MPYREKVAWLSLLSMFLVFAPYFTWTELNPPTDPLPNFQQMRLYAIACAAWGLLLGVGHLLLRRGNQAEAKLPLDERDIAIKYRSRDYAYGVMLVGMIIVGCVMPFRSNGWEIVNTAIFMIVLAEVVHYAAMIHSYRRQLG
jgi:hypothetical protein